MNVPYPKPKLVRRPLAVAGLWMLLALTGLVSCTTVDYYAQAINGQLDLLSRRESIDALIHRADIAADLRQRLHRVLQIRNFASSELGLPDNDSYRSYADVEREAMVWSLVAAPVFSTEPKTWCYPIVGCASYRGFFSQIKAEQAAAVLMDEGMDTAVQPVPAYSTLGWFDDPVPSTVIRWPEARLAGLIFHELAHQQLYVPGDTAFNEAFATTVEQEGVMRWLKGQGDPAMLAGWQQRQARKQALHELLLDARARLKTLYATAIPKLEMQQRKAEIIHELTSDYRKLQKSWSGKSAHDKWLEQPLNNAHLASVAAYHHWVPAFKALLSAHDGDLGAFYRACHQLGELPAAQRKQRLTQLVIVDGD